MAAKKDVEERLLKDEERALEGKKVERLPKEDRIKKYIGLAAEKSKLISPKLGQCLDVCGPCLSKCWDGICFVSPYIVWLSEEVYAFYLKCPHNVMQMIIGSALCFFGGEYVVSIAAIEAFRQLGGKQVWVDIDVIMVHTKTVIQKMAEDDLKDENNDGIADVDQISSKEFAKRKVMVVMTAVEDPESLQSALTSLMMAWVAVLASLKVMFAQCIALALGMVDMCKTTVFLVFAGPVSWLLGPDLKHWTETIIDTFLKIFAVIFAWTIQMIISAFYTGLRGGRIFADGLFNILEEHRITEKLPGWLVPQPYDADTTFVDDVVMYIMAGFGFWFQIWHGFSLPFPFNIIFFPLSAIEWFLRWSVTN